MKFTEDKVILKQKKTIGWHDVDAKGRLKLSALAVFLQEAAWIHSQQLGFGYDFMDSQNALWVLRSIHAKIYRYPKWNQSLSIETWHKSYQGLRALRDFLLTDESGNKLIAVTSDWMVIHKKTRRPLRLDMLDHFAESAKMIDALPEFECNQSAQGEQFEVLRNVRFSETDLYGHLNNTRYFEWLADELEDRFPDHQLIESFEMQFKHECRQNDQIRLDGSYSKDFFALKGSNPENEKSIFESCLVFSPSQQSNK